MKNSLNPILFCSAALLLSACSDDDDNKKSTSPTLKDLISTPAVESADDIYGTWLLVSETATYSSTERSGSTEEGAKADNDDTLETYSEQSTDITQVQTVEVYKDEQGKTQAEVCGNYYETASFDEETSTLTLSYSKVSDEEYYDESNYSRELKLTFSDNNANLTGARKSNSDDSWFNGDEFEYEIESESDNGIEGFKISNADEGLPASIKFSLNIAEANAEDLSAEDWSLNCFSVQKYTMTESGSVTDLDVTFSGSGVTKTPYTFIYLDVESDEGENLDIWMEYSVSEGIITHEDGEFNNELTELEVDIDGDSYTYQEYSKETFTNVPEALADELVDEEDGRLNSPPSFSFNDNKVSASVDFEGEDEDSDSSSGNNTIKMSASLEF